MNGIKLHGDNAALIVPALKPDTNYEREGKMDTQKALEWITDALGVQGRVVTLEDTRNSLAEWDSLGSLLLLSRLEEDHQLVVSADEIETIKSVREVCDLLEKANAFRAG